MRSCLVVRVSWINVGRSPVWNLLLCCLWPLLHPPSPSLSPLCTHHPRRTQFPWFIIILNVINVPESCNFFFFFFIRLRVFSSLQVSSWGGSFEYPPQWVYARQLNFCQVWKPNSHMWDVGRAPLNQNHFLETIQASQEERVLRSELCLRAARAKCLSQLSVQHTHLTFMTVSYRGSHFIAAAFLLMLC